MTSESAVVLWRPSSAWLGGAAVLLGILVAFAPELIGYGSLRATAGIALFAGFVLFGAHSAGMQLVYFVGIAPLLVFLEAGQTPFQLNETLRLLMLAVLLLQAAGKPAMRTVLQRTESKLLIAFLLWSGLLTLTYAIDWYIGLAVYVRHTSFLLLLILVPVLADAGLVRRWIIPIVLLTGLAAVTAGIGSVGVDLLSGRSPYGMGGNYRATGVFDSGAPNSFAVYLTTISLFGVSYIWMGRADLTLKLAALVPFAGSLGLVFYSFSRRALIALGIGVALIMLLMRGVRQRLFVIGGLVAVAIGVLLVIPLEVILNPRILMVVEAMASGDVTTAGPAVRRMEEWYGVSEHILWSTWSLLIGVQPGAASLFAARFHGVRLIPRIDNYYVSLTADYGLISLTLYLGIVAVVVYRLWKATRGDHPDRGIAVGALVGMSVILVSGLVGNTNMTFPNSMYLWLLPALALHVAGKPGERRGQ